jgi:hypothetical protein
MTIIERIEKEAMERRQKEEQERKRARQFDCTCAVFGFVYLTISGSAVLICGIFKLLEVL